MRTIITALLTMTLLVFGLVAPAQAGSGQFICQEGYGFCCVFSANTPRPGYPVEASTNILCSGAPIPRIKVRTTLYKDNGAVASVNQYRDGQRSGQTGNSHAALVKYYKTAGRHKYQTRSEVWVVGAAALIPYGYNWSKTITYG